MIELVYPIGPAAPVLPSATSAHPVRRKKSERQEMLPVIQENGLVTAMSDKAYCHNGSHLLHPVVHLYVIDREERIYLKKRLRKKDHNPGYWDISAEGHVIYGESIMESLYRAAASELNLKGFNPIYLRAYRCDTDRDSEFVIIFAAVGSFDLVPDSDGRWWSLAEIEKSLGSEVFADNFPSEFKSIIHQLLALL